MGIRIANKGNCVVVVTEGRVSGKEMRSRYADMEVNSVKERVSEVWRKPQEQYEQTYCRSVFVVVVVREVRGMKLTSNKSTDEAKQSTRCQLLSVWMDGWEVE